MPSKCQQAGARSLSAWLRFLAEAPSDTTIHFQVIIPGAITGKQSHGAARAAHADPSRSPGASTWGPTWHPRLPSPAAPRSHPELATQIHPTRISCKPNAKVSESFLRICTRFCSVSGHGLPATGILEALLSWIPSLYKPDPPGCCMQRAGSIQQQEQGGRWSVFSYCGNWI